MIGISLKAEFRQQLYVCNTSFFYE